MKHVATNQMMGPLFLAMPRVRYQGAFASSIDVPTSKLISSTDGIESELIASTIAARLSQRLQMAVYCSCSLEDTPIIAGCDGVLEQQLLRSRAGALAEKEIVRLLQEKIVITKPLAE